MSAAFAGPSDWTLADMDDSKIWLHKHNTDITGSLQAIKRDEPLEWSAIDKKSFYQQFEERKKRSLGIIGVRDWKATNYKFETRDGVESLIIEGTYFDPSGIEVFFKELHLFYPTETLQFLYTQPITISNAKKYEEEFFSFALTEGVKK